MGVFGWLCPLQATSCDGKNESGRVLTTPVSDLLLVQDPCSKTDTGFSLWLWLAEC